MSFSIDWDQEQTFQETSTNNDIFFEPDFSSTTSFSLSSTAGSGDCVSSGVASSTLSSQLSDGSKNHWAKCVMFKSFKSSSHLPKCKLCRLD